MFLLLFIFYLAWCLNWEAGKGIQKTLNSMKTDLGGETIDLIWSKGWLLMMGVLLLGSSQERNHSQLPELLGCYSGGIKHNGKGYPCAIILPAHPIGAFASILPHCMAGLRRTGPWILKFKESLYPFSSLLICTRTEPALKLCTWKTSH